MSAIRNLNETEVRGRPLRIVPADSPSFLEGKTTVRGEVIDEGTPGPSDRRSQWRTSGTGNSRSHGSDAFLASLPPSIQVPKGASALDYISSTLANMQPSQLMEVLSQMKAFVITHPEQARSLLTAHPQLAYALFQALLLTKIVDLAILQRMLATTSGSTQQPTPLPLHPPMPPPPHLQQPPPNSPNPHLGYPLQSPQLQQPQSYPGLTISPISMPPASAMFPHHQQHQPLAHHPLPPAMPLYYRPPPPLVVPVSTPQPQVQSKPQAQQPVQRQVQAPAATIEINDHQRSMILQVLSMTSEQINAVSEKERVAILQLRNQFNLGG